MARSPIPRLVPLALAPVILLAGCSEASIEPTVSDPPPSEPTVTEPTVTEPITTPASRCEGLAIVRRVSIDTDAQLLEISGAARSNRTPDHVWVHEDSGNAPVLVEVAPDGSEHSRWTLSALEPVDWEDMASAPIDGVVHLFVADIGDNRARRDHLELIRLAEPGPETPSGAVEAYDAITLTSSIGPADAEALLVDPLTDDVVVLTKALDGATQVLVAGGAARADAGATVTLDHAGTLRLGLGRAVLAGDLSPDGATIGLRTPTGVLLWERAPGASVAATLLGGPPCRAPAPFDPLGEALALFDDGYVVVGEVLRGVDQAELVTVR